VNKRLASVTYHRCPTKKHSDPIFWPRFRKQQIYFLGLM